MDSSLLKKFDRTVGMGMPIFCVHCKICRLYCFRSLGGDTHCWLRVIENWWFFASFLTHFVSVSRSFYFVQQLEWKFNGVAPIWSRIYTPDGVKTPKFVNFFTLFYTSFNYRFIIVKLFILIRARKYFHAIDRKIKKNLIEAQSTHRLLFLVYNVNVFSGGDR